ncbi:ester cyclase [Amycolatopsis sp. NPDC004169]|uniref:ester cyclase n=1 Tax=Amycolatopsis sp. NPDC004169 TaxID=3154453 RepID=UPI00339DB8ED
MLTTPLQSALDVFRVLETGDPDLARAAAAPTFVNREAAVAPPACSVPGPRGLLASGAWMRAAFDDLRFPVLDAGFDDGTAWIRLRMQGVQNRPFVQFHDGRPARVLPATGRPIDFEQVHLLKVGDDGVTSHEAVRDDLTMLGQLGAFPPSPAMLLAIVKGKLTGASRRAAASAAQAAEEASRLG